MPKDGRDSFPYEQHQRFFNNVILTLINREDLVEQELVSIRGSGVVEQLNSILEARDSQRRKDWQGTRVADVEYGMLVQDLRNTDPEHTTIIEFKPKWLLPSPNAPADAVRCRSCARNAQQRSLGKQVKQEFCSLDLLICRVKGPKSEDAALRVLHAVFEASPLSTEAEKQSVVHWLQTTPLFTRLARAQGQLNPTGFKEGEITRESLTDLQAAQTLRDCACFLKVPRGTTGTVEARLGDMDEKNGYQKLQYWIDTELDLINGGLYQAKEAPLQKAAPCQLEAYKTLKDEIWAT